MTKRHPKSLIQHKEESEIDKTKYLNNSSVYGQNITFRQLLGIIQNQGIHCPYDPISFELIDFTASFIASLLSGNDFFLLCSPPPIGSILDKFRENVNFIHKTLSKAQISCSSLICSLWYMDQYFHQPHYRNHHLWKNPCDLFIASIVVADKADVTWLNIDWAEWTHYTTPQINALEKQFLQEINFNLYISQKDYHNFVSYLEFRLHSRQLLGILSYRDIDVLSQELNPIYMERLQLNLRPFGAMMLIAKQATSILAVYVATLVMVGCVGYCLKSVIEQGVYMVLQDRKEDIMMIILSGIDLIKKEQVNNYNLLQKGSTRYSVTCF